MKPIWLVYGGMLAAIFFIGTVIGAWITTRSKR